MEVYYMKNRKDYAIHRMREYRIALSFESDFVIDQIENELIELSDEPEIKEAMIGIFDNRVAGETFFRFLRKEV